MDFFTSHGDYIDVMETVAGKLAGIISGTAGVPSIAFATAFKRAGLSAIADAIPYRFSNSTHCV